MIGKVLKWGFIVFIGYYVIKDPSGAAGTAHGLLGGLQGAANSLAQFVSGIGSK